MSIFSQVKASNPKSNTFDLGHQVKLSGKMGKLIPILTMETVPGDKIKLSTSQLIRFAPMVAPMMHQVSVYVHYFFVPNRIVWEGWQDFITGGEDGTDATVFPYVEWNSLDDNVGTLADYLGLPIQEADMEINISPFTFAGYQKICNEYYRDQNLVTAVDDIIVDGNNTASFNGIRVLQNRAWQHDYFTSALPWTQKGAEATIPLGTTAPVIFDFNQVGDSPVTGQKLYDNTGAHYTSDPGSLLNHEQGANFGLTGRFGAGTDTPLHLDVSKDHSVDLSQATSATINDLRNAFRLQEWLEKNARGGSRYIEVILSHFGVKSSDARLQRPEFLGGSATPVTISEVVQTSANASEPTPQGNMAGHGISLGGAKGINYYCEEHGYLYAIMSVMPKTAYAQGIPKHLLKNDKFDYFWPEFAHLGEQPILNMELFIRDDDENENTFGYTPRYAEYKYFNDQIRGEFRTSLDFWTMYRKFSTRPSLNSAFVTSDPTTRVFAVESGEQFYAQIVHNIKAKRKMPYFGTPKF